MVKLIRSDAVQLTVPQAHGLMWGMRIVNI